MDRSNLSNDANLGFEVLGMARRGFSADLVISAITDDVVLGVVGIQGDILQTHLREICVPDDFSVRVLEAVGSVNTAKTLKNEEYNCASFAIDLAGQPQLGDMCDSVPRGFGFDRRSMYDMPLLSTGRFISSGRDIETAEAASAHWYQSRVQRMVESPCTLMG